MKFKKQKYLFIAILAFLATSCGSSGGGGSSSQNSTAPPTSGDIAKPDTGNSSPQNENNKPNPDGNKPGNESGDNKPDSNNPPNVNKPDNGDDDNNPAPPENPNPGGNDEDSPPPKPDNSKPPENNKPDNNNSGDITINSSSDRGLITDNKNITNYGNITTNQPLDVNLNVIPILSKNGFTGTNNGLITGTNSSNNKIMYGMMGSEDGNIVNTGNINLIGQNVVGISLGNPTVQNKDIFATNNGNIDLKIDSDFKNAMVNEEDTIYLAGMEASANLYGSYALSNNGEIKVDSSKYNNNLHHFGSIGMSLTVSSSNTNSHTITNSKNITMIGDESIGILALGKNISASNIGEISVTGINTVGMEIINGKDSTAINKGTITTKGDSSSGITVLENGTGTNDTNGVINVNGNNEITGMRAGGKFAKVINKGKINVAGNGGIGIYVFNEAYGINETTGTITIGEGSAHGMSAESGGTIENKGKIILAGTTQSSIGMYSLGDRSSIINSGQIIMENEDIDGTYAIYTNGGKYINTGKIMGKGNIEITGDNLGKFIVGSENDGTVGTVVSRKIKIDGNVVADKNLIKSDKKKISYENVFVAPTIELVKENNEQAVSLFYNSDLKKNNLGNVDMEIYRNKNSVGKIYESKNFNSLISELDKFLNTEHSTLSKDETLMADKILKTSEALEIQKTVKGLSGEIYSNLPKQIFDIQSQFLKEDKKLMNTLDYYDYNFNFFGDRKSFKDKGEFSGYETRTAGFVGMKKTENNIYGSIGFEHSDIKYNEGSRGTIQTIHTGIYKEIFVNEYDINLGLRADYSFHETNRKLHEFGRTAKIKQNGSYSIGFNSEISRTFGDVGFLYIKPIVGFDLSYGKYDGFREKNAGDFGLDVKGDDYLSILPNVGFKIGRDFQDAKLYSNIIYTYEFGDLNKKQDMSLLNNKVNYSLASDNLEENTLIANIGMSTSINYIDISFEIGKEIGKRDNNYLTLAVGYRF